MYSKHILAIIFFPTIQNYKARIKLLENYLWCFSNFGPVRVIFVIEEPSIYFKKFFKASIGEEISGFSTGSLRWSYKGGIGVFASEKGQHFSDLANIIIENTEAEHYLLIEPHTLVFPNLLELFNYVKDNHNYNVVYATSDNYNIEQFKDLNYEDFNFRMFLKIKDGNNFNNFINKRRNSALLSKNHSVLLARRSILEKTSFRESKNNSFLYELLFDSDINFGVYFIRDIHTLKLTIGEV